ncbi:hypothetical protein SEA_SPILLED_256 [Streptomyces phage Spilled]|jgi:hypothetical protein|uniref:Uncharacterized protein n=5 Tax=Karimacvirus TaxID=2843400 RepID=A0A5Q2WQN4_9CAUD|nr:hypothetical protein [Streptomyces sp. JV178]YP_009840135.1 hypothetical protein HWB79_gp076 [Streptomyces phage LukeCage]YP_009840378.1 hypothetical protein HWB80_gp074 [Streptomyces phage Karimac]AXH66709.1 hypothetical protein SEA_STARBOW_246 [Streptomyces phage Starbow]QDF17367.1 hypothetical protein SEA_BIRCHLYN_248 [Streptomyces phage Birchlyn]QFP97520.1 hypothetical protein SEA_ICHABODCRANE_243 [Streptomyces phage IchabodCrane]QGH74446.1 hypothetical protein SEA_WIPEOUT_239 [Strepto
MDEYRLTVEGAVLDSDKAAIASLNKGFGLLLSILTEQIEDPDHYTQQAFIVSAQLHDAVAMYLERHGEW